MALAIFFILFLMLPAIYAYAPSFVSLTYLVLTGLAILLAHGNDDSTHHEIQSTKEPSRKACEKAFEKLQQWTSENVINAENFGYHKQLTEECERYLDRHLMSYPYDEVLPLFRWYRAYINRSYDFTIKKW